MFFKNVHYSSWSKGNNNLCKVSDDDMKTFHSILLGMYKDIYRVCSAHGITVMAVGGTALGAVRHQGFIPWDDDMDLCMLRGDYEKFKGVFEKELSQDYILLAPHTRQGANCFFPRIMKKDSTWLGMIDETSPHPHGIYIDLNIIEFAPENKIALYTKALISDASRFISYSVYWYKYRSESLREFMTGSKGANYYRLRIMVGRLFSFVSPEKWFDTYDRVVQGKSSSVCTNSGGAKKYIGELIPYDVVFPPKRVQFEDTEIDIFNDCKWYLEKQYGNYMRIPTPEEREKHLLLKYDFEKQI